MVLTSSVSLKMMNVPAKMALKIAVANQTSSYITSTALFMATSQHLTMDTRQILMQIVMETIVMTTKTMNQTAQILLVTILSVIRTRSKPR